MKEQENRDCEAVQKKEGAVKQESGDDSGEDPPVPIPNTEVKLSSAEDTWRATARENMTLPVLLKRRSAEADRLF